MKDKYCDIKQILWHQTSYTKKLNQILMFYKETPEYLFNMSEEIWEENLSSCYKKAANN